MIRAGRAAAYDFNVFLPTFCIVSVALAAACKSFGIASPPQSASKGPKLQLGG
jgi:hypothetical protein